MDIYNGNGEIVCSIGVERDGRRSSYKDCQIVIRRAHLNFSFSNVVEYIVGKLYVEPEEFIDSPYKVAFPYYEGSVIVCDFTGKNFDENAYNNLLCATAETLYEIIDKHLIRLGKDAKAERATLIKWKNQVIENYGIREVCVVREDMPGYLAMKGSEVRRNVE